MDILESCAVTTLATDCCKKYIAMAFDGCYFYMTSPLECSVHKFSSELVLECGFETCRAYTSLCYDPVERCFWAAADRLDCFIYKLNCNMQEIDRLQVKTARQSPLRIKGLSCDCENNMLLVAFPGLIAQVSKQDGTACILQEACSGCFTGVLSIAPLYMAVSIRADSQTILLYDRSGNLLRSFCLPMAYWIEDLVFDSCAAKKCDVLPIIILSTKHCCYPRLLHWEAEACGAVVCPCNYLCCRKPCKTDSEECVCSVIESVAMMEAALAHVLDAEGEKMKKAVKLADNTDQLVEINRYLNKTLINATHLEQILYSKLDIFGDRFLGRRKKEDSGDEPGHKT